MPLIASRFSPPFLLRNGHIQTILGAILPRSRQASWSRERLELPDGDFVDLDWSRCGRPGLAIISHGLEGSSSNSDILGLAFSLNAAGWDVLAWNFRGCSGEPNRLARFYHSGETADLAAVIDHASAGYSAIALIGFSLGGNVTLKYLGEGGVHPLVRAAAAVSVPVDLAASARALDCRPSNRIYLRRFMRSLAAKIEAKAERFSLDVAGLKSVSGFSEFDDRYTAPLHGFPDAETYWAECSALRFLSGIEVPALLLNAQDDPFLTAESYPSRLASRHLSLGFESPRWGGHLGFVDLSGAWLERRIPEFLQEFLPQGHHAPARD